ncbi:MAG: DUF1080 domain-containing protein [Planctomycetaceae bacterium]|nr:DUF1080 domain-containing protein [Planctomycetaceae bacterium]
MIRCLLLATVLWGVLGSIQVRGDNPLVWRGGIHGREFSEVGRLYLGRDKLIHFRTNQRIYYFSHMYYIWDALQKSEAVAEGKVIYDKPIRISGAYSKAGAVYNFLEEPALRGSQIVWIDRVEKVDLPEKSPTVTSLFDGDSLIGWSMAPSNSEQRAAWEVVDQTITSVSSPNPGGATLMSQSSFTNFELCFEYRSSWGVSASLLLRANEAGDGIALSLDHIDEGIVGFPKSATHASRPFVIVETREQRGVGAATHHHVQFDGRVNYDGVSGDRLLDCCKLSEFLNEWDGAYWNLVKVRCVGADPEITVWINGFKVNRFKANSVCMQQKKPDHLGAIENFAVHPSGHIGFSVHSKQSAETSFLLRELRITAVEPIESSD